ncbi:hypothetical protein Pmgp_00277 [Pelotomaculum propionicicum]|uniref:Uncharacterized protein n=1 Tax=Pelotomaculum propionicicum TaxID=258475 RepID=A0A4Y7RX12_9FIRM|nr:hypothetical protein Pmgp_00277 [Pelotomaculum propionicicum]
MAAFAFILVGFMGTGVMEIYVVPWTFWKEAASRWELKQDPAFIAMAEMPPEWRVNGGDYLSTAEKIWRTRRVNNMAHIETWYRCPTCNKLYDNLKDALSCKNQHQITLKRWAVGKGGKAVKVQENCVNGVEKALTEADLSDFTHERAKQLREIKNKRK